MTNLTSDKGNMSAEELILKELGTVMHTVDKEMVYFNNPAIEEGAKSKSFFFALKY